MIRPQGNSVGAVQFAVRIHIGCREGSHKARRADVVSQLVMEYLNHHNVTDGVVAVTEETGLTYETYLRRQSRAYVTEKMFGVSFVISWMLSLFLSALISTVIRLIVEWWMTANGQLDE